MMHLYCRPSKQKIQNKDVLILVVMDDALVLSLKIEIKIYNLS